MAAMFALLTFFVITVNPGPNSQLNTRGIIPTSGYLMLLRTSAAPSLSGSQALISMPSFFAM